MPAHVLIGEPVSHFARNVRYASRMSYRRTVAHFAGTCAGADKEA